ncbi:nuclear RNA export factor 1-like [Vespa crabro]|uniref:nuclear RNA export factor 1-like n=1 Tax=Vespa crabro TaxID=7445 RepID=UPI001F0327CA|nr:nuclear RNA export factor 1-like [Vespa crabro]
MQRNLGCSRTRTLDSSVAMKLTMGQNSMFQERLLMENPNLWHEFKVIRGAQYNKEEVLKAILNSIKPIYLLPVKYQVRGEDSYFIAKNCGPAIEKLCRSSLIIKNPHGNPLILTIVLGFAPVQDLNVNIQPLLLTTLTRRYDSNTKSLDLEAFHKDLDLSKSIYCPLSQITNLEHVLKVAKKTVATFEHLNLKHNELYTLDAMQSLDLISLKYIDLRYNSLMNMKDLGALKNLTIVKLWLDGNPLCENYSSAKQYINSVKVHCPHIIQLDGVSISVSDMPLMYNNYFKDSTKQELVYQFVTHFFNLYDQGDRTLLRGLYDKHAFYSFSFSIPFSIAHKRKLVQFTTNRNIFKITDPNKRDKFLYYGEDNVLNALKTLPKTYHDKNSFQYDLIYDDNECIAISISGLFKNIGSDPQVLSFNRTFILSVRPDNEYIITNDQYNIGDAPDNKSLTNIDSTVSSEDFIPECFSSTEKFEIITKFGQITKLTKEWCKTYLNKTNWDMRKSIQNFIKDLKSNTVPQEAFKI